MAKARTERMTPGELLYLAEQGRIEAERAQGMLAAAQADQAIIAKAVAGEREARHKLIHMLRTEEQVVALDERAYVLMLCLGLELACRDFRGVVAKISKGWEG